MTAAAMGPARDACAEDSLAFLPAWERRMWTRLYHLISGAASLAGGARARLPTRFVNALVVTNFRGHRHWAGPDGDVVFVATDDARAELVRHGIARDQVHVVGTPVRDELAPVTGAARDELRARVGFGEDPVLVVSAGGPGAHCADDRLLAGLGAWRRPLDVVTFAGAARPVEQRGALRIHCLGFRDDFGAYLAACGAVIGRLGSVTAAPAALRRAPGAAARFAAQLEVAA